jgi:hypothetical protein
MKKILIVAPSYSANNGGSIILHKLCHIINSLGREAYLFPFVDNFELNKFNYKSVLLRFFKKHLREPFRKFKTIPNLNTPVLKKRPENIATDEWIVVYPEIIFGNPLYAKNVVRWLLHNPGFHNKDNSTRGGYFYGSGELYFRIGNWFKDFQHPGSTTSPFFLQIFHYPFHLYNKNDVEVQRSGTAYCIRKGINKKISHDLTDSILIDGLKHEEISKIFKRVKTFISYDPHTTFSYFAALCGCDSIVIPDEGITEEDWVPNEEDRYGVAYGFESIDKARQTANLVFDRFKKFEESSESSVISFLRETDKFFAQNGKNI